MSIWRKLDIRSNRCSRAARWWWRKGMTRFSKTINLTEQKQKRKTQKHWTKCTFYRKENLYTPARPFRKWTQPRCAHLVSIRPVSLALFIVCAMRHLLETTLSSVSTQCCTEGTCQWVAFFIFFCVCEDPVQKGRAKAAASSNRTSVLSDCFLRGSDYQDRKTEGGFTVSRVLRVSRCLLDLRAAVCLVSSVCLSLATILGTWHLDVARQPPDAASPPPSSSSSPLPQCHTEFLFLSRSLLFALSLPVISLRALTQNAVDSSLLFLQSGGLNSVCQRKTRRRSVKTFCWCVPEKDRPEKRHG